MACQGNPRFPFVGFSGAASRAELTDAFFDQAEVFRGDTFVRRGRPRLDAPKEQINIRLDAEVLSLLRRHGPGWQTRINEMLREALGLGKSD
jgi:uncharacterized protein (DUF4415 family)